MSDMFRRDAYIKPVPGQVIAEFSCATQAMEFIDKCLDRSYTVTAGINFPYAVRKALPADLPYGHPTPWDDVPGDRDPYLAGDHREISTESTVGTVDPAAAASSRSSACGGGFVLRALSERGRQAMPALESGLLAAGIPWTRGEV